MGVVPGRGGLWGGLGTRSEGNGATGVDTRSKGRGLGGVCCGATYVGRRGGAECRRGRRSGCRRRRTKRGTAHPSRADEPSRRCAGARQKKSTPSTGGGNGASGRDDTATAATVPAGGVGVPTLHSLAPAQRESTSRRGKTPLAAAAGPPPPPLPKRCHRPQTAPPATAVAPPPSSPPPRKRPIPALPWKSPAFLLASLSLREGVIQRRVGRSGSAVVERRRRAPPTRPPAMTAAVAPLRSAAATRPPIASATAANGERRTGSEARTIVGRVGRRRRPPRRPRGVP